MPRTDPATKVVLFPSALYTFSTTAPFLQLGSAGVRLFLNVSAISGNNASLIVQLEEIDPLSRNGFEPTSWQFPQVMATGTWELTIYPGIQTSANQAVNGLITGNILVSAFIGGDTPQIRFSLCAVPIW